MATQPLGAPKFRAFDANGDPLAGGKLYSYEAGTTTPLATYTTRAGNVANANPVILDANGEANVWMEAGTLYKFALYTSADVLQWTVDNFPSPEEQDAATSEAGAVDPGGRLTLTSLTPVTTSNVTGATTVYYAPYKHNRVPLYDGTSWTLHAIATELSQTTADNTKSPAAVANSSNYDLFVWSDSGTLRLSRGPAWSSDTSRGTGAGTTELERVDGRYLNKVSISNGPAAQRGTYVGTVRSDGSAQINDSQALRHVWNAYNRAPRVLLQLDTTDSWNYTTATFRQANGAAANQLDVVLGLNEDAVTATVLAVCSNSSGTNVLLSVGIGIDSTTVNSAKLCPAAHSVSSIRIQISATYSDFIGIGRHTLVWLEYSEATGTTTWQGDSGIGTRQQSGIIGQMLA